MGSRGKGRIIIKFPFTLESGWYSEQPCTKFRAFQHRKERKGFQHEFIVLMLLDGSLCRVERMGDPNARFDALSPHGTIAHDMAQCFRPEEIDQACLESSDLVAEVTLPCDFDIMDVLKICRAIHEGEKTRNYTLQIYNCWFFSLAIQVCLTRLVAHWEDQELLEVWLSHVNKGIRMLTNTDQSPGASTPTLHRQIFSQVYSILRPQNDNYWDSLERDFKLQFQSQACADIGLTIAQQIAYRVNNLLWYSTIDSGLSEFIEEEVHDAIMAVLRNRFLIAPTLKSGPQSLEGLKFQSLAMLVVLLGLAGRNTGKMPRSPHEYHNLKRKLIDLATVGHNPKTDTAELRSGEPSVRRTTKKVEKGWYSRTKSCMQHLERLILWLLHAILSLWGINLLSPQLDTVPCVIIDQQLESITSKLAYSDGIERSDLEEFIKRVRELIGNQAAIWNRNPWNHIHEFIAQSMPGDILEGIELHKPKLGFRINEQSPEQSTLDVSTFQIHVINRIKIHAEEVENNWLGTACSIRAELEDVLSRVWETIYEETNETQKEQKAENAVDPEFDSSIGNSSIAWDSRCSSTTEQQALIKEILDYLPEELVTNNAYTYCYQPHVQDEYETFHVQLRHAPRPGRKKALCVGINYTGLDVKLEGCINDVHKVANFLTVQFGYKPENIRKLTDDAMDPNFLPIRDNIITAMRWLVEDAQPTDSLFFHYSGHGGQTKDVEWLDFNVFCAVIYPLNYEQAGHIVNHEMHEIMVKHLPAGCRLTAIFDVLIHLIPSDLPYTYSTEGKLKEHSQIAGTGHGLLSVGKFCARGDVTSALKSLGSVIRPTMSKSVRRQVTKHARETRTSEADVVSWAACKDSEKSDDAYEGDQAVGAMSYAFVEALRQKPHQSYRELLNNVRTILRTKYQQKPQLSSSHPIDTNNRFIA